MPKSKLVKRADDRYAKQVTVGKNPNGKPKKKTVYGKTEKEVEKKYRELMSTIDSGFSADKNEMTVSGLYKEWYRIKKQGKIRANTIKSYETMSKHVKDVMGHEKVKDITLYNIESMIADIENKGHKRTALAVLRLINAMMEYAVRNKMIALNPCAEVSVQYCPKEKRALTDGEKDGILKNINKLRERQKIYLLILRYTGMREGEVLALSKDDIDKNNLTITVSKTLVTGAGKPFIQDLTKTKAGVRKIPIFLPLVKPLFDYMDSLASNDLFTTSSGNYISIGQISEWTDQIKKHIGFGEDITMHSLRHNFISECYAAGVDIKVLQKWIGHADISTTLNIYTHLADEELKKSEKMNLYFASQMEVKKQSEEITQPLKLVK